MIIGIDASALNHSDWTGIEKATYQIICHLIKENKSNKIRLYLAKKLKMSLPQSQLVSSKIIPFPRFWHLLRLPLELIFNPPDILFVPAYTVPLFAPQKTVVFVHDLAFWKYPGAYSASQRFIQKVALKRTARKAACLIFPSDSSQKDFLSYFPNFSRKAIVLPLASNFESGNSALAQPCKQTKPYFLFVGRLEERKNVKRIIEAFVQAKQNTSITEQLVLVGKPGFGYKAICEAIESSGEIKRDIITKGYISDQELDALYANASAFLCPSLYEGFGLTILEAFNHSLPVITSNISSMPEVAKDSALLVNPLQSNEIAEAMVKIATDQKLDQELRQKGQARSKDFSWQKTAKRLLELLQSM